MFQKLKKHWNVTGKQLVLILCTFAVTGTLTAWLSKKAAEWLVLDKYGAAWWLSKVLVLIFGYQVIILVVGFIFGMFPFFWKYEKKILKRMRLLKDTKPVLPAAEPVDTARRIAIFASGTGSNAQKIIDHFRENSFVKVVLVVCNNPHAGVLNIAAREGIPVLLIEKKKFNETGYVKEIKKTGADLLILAGFLWKVPPVLIRNFPHHIINIHPALLPGFGGKGMYGNAVHTAVIKAGKKESGITIHYVDEEYDHGAVIFQATCAVDKEDTPESLAEKVHALEHHYFPLKIEEIIKAGG